ncbi:hypothetical protein BKA62DRAFT_79208 [Auriculariales sp. MPI-PUGE-AT-0066]|nr:hypothetical protein BKA62DRAFT_79208 [Auriculariales sp. MPI-PUGE-AT-0066]
MSLPDESELDVDAIQAQIDMAMSATYGLVGSWMKTSSMKASSSKAPAAQTTEQELAEYMRRPPRLGLGATVSKSDAALHQDAAKLAYKLTNGKGKKRARDEDLAASTSRAEHESDDNDESRAGSISTASALKLKSKQNFSPFGDSFTGKKSKKRKTHTEDAQLADASEPQPAKKPRSESIIENMPPPTSKRDEADEDTLMDNIATDAVHQHNVPVAHPTTETVDDQSTAERKKRRKKKKRHDSQADDGITRHSDAFGEPTELISEAPPPPANPDLDMPASDHRAEIILQERKDKKKREKRTHPMQESTLQHAQLSSAPTSAFASERLSTSLALSSPSSFVLSSAKMANRTHSGEFSAGGTTISSPSSPISTKRISVSVAPERSSAAAKGGGSLSPRKIIAKTILNLNGPPPLSPPPATSINGIQGGDITAGEGEGKKKRKRKKKKKKKAVDGGETLSQPLPQHLDADDAESDEDN